MNKSLVIGDEFLALKVTAEVSADQSSSSTLTQSIIFFLNLVLYTERHCHVRIEKSPNCCYNIRSTQFPRISLYA